MSDQRKGGEEMYKRHATYRMDGGASSHVETPIAIVLHNTTQHKSDGARWQTTFEHARTHADESRPIIELDGPIVFVGHESDIGLPEAESHADQFLGPGFLFFLFCLVFYFFWQVVRGSG